ncbi:MAG: hypothetical protein GY940_20575 [bacterium]|nr:hypothetical protein [bacterium]
MFKHSDKSDSRCEAKLTMLENSIYYFLEFVFIEIREEKYRLVVCHQRHVMTDELYNTMRGAKIAFTKFYKKKAWKEAIKPVWSPFYLPDPTWLSEKLPHNFFY